MIYFNNRNGSSGLTRRLILPDWSPLLLYMADGTAHYAEKVGDTQHLDSRQMDQIINDDA